MKRKHPEETFIFWWEMLITQYIILLILSQNWIVHVVPSHINTAGSKKVDVHCEWEWSLIQWGDCTGLVSLILKQTYSRNHRFSGWKAPSKVGTQRPQTRTEWVTNSPPAISCRCAGEENQRHEEKGTTETLFQVPSWSCKGLKAFWLKDAVCFICMSICRYLYLKKTQTKQNIPNSPQWGRSTEEDKKT